jgi:hypothetical protein
VYPEGQGWALPLWIRSTPSYRLLSQERSQRKAALVQWAPPIKASGVRTPARIYDLRSTFASNALAAGVSVFQLARIMGRHYGAMLDGSSAEIATQLDALDAAQDRDGEALLEDG